MSHTPGPWRVEPDLSKIGGVVMSTGNCIGTADDYEWGYLRIEDARLIAAAPDLLAAAKNALCSCSIPEIYSGHRVDCWMPEMNAAIAKAES